MNEQQATIAILRKMYDLLEPEGAWCQGAAYRSSYGAEVYDDTRVASRCLTGAWYDARRATELNLADRHRVAGAARQAWAAVRLRLPKQHESPPSWNDLPSTTQEDVLLVIKKAIADVEAEAPQ